MQTKKSDARFQIVSGLVMRLSMEERSNLLNFLVGHLWREEELYEGVERWLKDKESQVVSGVPVL